MKVRIQIQNLNETVEAPDAAALLAILKRDAARRAPLLMRPVIKSMSDLGFAAEAVKHANAAGNRHDPVPRTAQEFLDWAIAQGYVSIEQS